MDPNVQNNSFLTKLDINDRNVYIKVMWIDDENDVFRLKLYEGERTWSGRFCTEFSEKFRECFDETKAEYLKNVKLSLTGDSEEYTHVFNETGEDQAAFVWKKTFVGSTATRIHGLVPLKPDAPEPKDSLIDFLLNENKLLHQAIANTITRTNIVTEELNKCKQEIEKYVNTKTSLESVLYGKFVQILNSKKRRIELLEENIQNYREGKKCTTE